MKNPLISVIMPVYNGERYLRQAVESVLSQSFSDFEFIIVNDGSTDSTQTLIETYQRADQRIRVIKQRNRGVSAARNHAIKLAQGKYIAMQDADDASLPTRLEEQYSFLERNSNVGVVGSNYYVINNAGERIFTTSVFTKPSDLKLALVFSNQFGQGTIMARAGLLKANGYNQRYRYAEDYDLWLRLSTEVDLANMKRPLYEWRQHEESVSEANSEKMQDSFVFLRDKAFDYYLNHRQDYSRGGFNVFSTLKGPLNYLSLKGTLYRDMSLLYYINTSRRRSSFFCLIISILYAPWDINTHYYLYVLVFRRSLFKTLKYEFI